MLTLLILLAIVVAVAFWGVGIYNGLVTSRNGYKNAFAQIDVQLQRRFDLIPNLVEVARKYMAHERETLEAVIAVERIGPAARIELVAIADRAAVVATGKGGVPALAERQRVGGKKAPGAGAAAKAHP